jgi:diguanylate cyclase (GGDEF)-like protein
LIAGLALQCVPTWFLIREAGASPDVLLVDRLPPVEVLQLLIMMLAMAFLPRREGWLVAVLGWIGLAVPVLFFLFMHPEELRTLRGLHLVVGLGPVGIMMLVMIPLFRGIDHEVTSLQVDRQRMQDLAERDALTGLHNRRAGEAWLREAQRDGERDIGLILFDVDHFKSINDRYGHTVGDQVLCELCLRCQSVLRRDDRLIRWGGEEFLVLLRRVDRTTVGRLAEAMRAACKRRPIEPVGVVSASFGLAVWANDESIHEALERADTAMYAAKRAGRDRVVDG